MNAGPSIEGLREAHVAALWAHAGNIGDQPRATEPPFHWRWSKLKQLADLAGDQVSSDDAERRVLVLANPVFGGRLATTGTLNAAIQVLNPGETAQPHRHSMAAIRLITDHDGGATMVNGSKCPMVAGDLILTPPWCWHGHLNDTERRLIWVDVLDVPLIMSWNAVFFEHPDASSPKIADAVAWRDSAWSGAGVVPSGLTPTAEYSPKLRYAWSETKPALDAVPPDSDGRQEIHYVNPLNGAPIMATIDCHAVRLSAGQETRPRRSTASTVCYVVDGEGQSKVGQEEFSWSKNDVFTIPNWQWASHKSDGVAYLMEVSNRAMLAKLGMLRVEAR